MRYDPTNQLSDDELDILARKNFDEFLDYLDQKAAHLKQFIKPLSSYHTKRFASLSMAQQGKQITSEELKKAETIGKDNEKKVINKIKNK
tara:strand:+ start:228 stop:497 length:270 start_codon:yes stop_codon:yes gene_type:complete